MTLYKYSPTARFFQNQLVRFTPPSALNDPDEARPELSFGRYSDEDYATARRQAALAGMPDTNIEELETFFMNPMPAPRFDEKSFPELWPAQELRLRPKPFSTIAEYDHAVAERAIELLGELANQTIGIFSLSRVLSEPMRAYYSRDHSGIVVGFDEKHPFFAQKCHDVEYSDKAFSVSSNQGWVRILGTTYDNNDILEARIRNIPGRLFLRKRLGWRHEQEVRVIAPLREANTIVESSPDGYPIHLFRIPADAVLSVEFGYAAAPTFFEETMSLIANSSDWRHLTIFRRCRLKSREIETQQIR